MSTKPEEHETEVIVLVDNDVDGEGRNLLHCVRISPMWSPEQCTCLAVDRRTTHPAQYCLHIHSADPGFGQWIWIETAERKGLEVNFILEFTVDAISLLYVAMCFAFLWEFEFNPLS